MKRFFFDWVIEDQLVADEAVESSMPRRSVGFLSFLPMMFFHAARATPKSVLVEAVTALAFANYGRRLKYPEALTQALKSYCTALNLLKQLILDPAGARKDETLVSIALLGMYEAGFPTLKPSYAYLGMQRRLANRLLHQTLISPSYTMHGSWTAHLNGAATLLSARCSRNSNPKIVAGLCGMLFNQMVNKDDSVN